LSLETSKSQKRESSWSSESLMVDGLMSSCRRVSPLLVVLWWWKWKVRDIG